MAPEAQAGKQPTPALLFDTINAYQRTQALKAASIWKYSRPSLKGGKKPPRKLPIAAPHPKRARASVRLSDDHGIPDQTWMDVTFDAYSAVFPRQTLTWYMGTVSEFMLSPHIKEFR